MLGVTERWLVLEDDDELRRTLTDALSLRAGEVVACGSIQAALEALGEGAYTGMVVDVVLPDGDAVTVAERALSLKTVPAIVAISGSAAPSATFRLAQLGVRAFLTKPVKLEDLDRAIDEALRAPPDVAPHVRGAVGRVPIQELEEKVRDAMVDEAIARAGGNIREAARILQISRQMLQHILRRRR
jgi:two-component system response regulator RegA